MLAGLNEMLAVLCGVAVMLDVVMLLVSIVPRARPFSGGFIVYSSFLFGATTWLTGVLVTWALWGGFVTFIGLFFFGVGPVFMALLATAFRGMWGPTGGLALWLTLTVASRLIGGAIAAVAPKPAFDIVAG